MKVVYQRTITIVTCNNGYPEYNHQLIPCFGDNQTLEIYVLEIKHVSPNNCKCNSGYDDYESQVLDIY